MTPAEHKELRERFGSLLRKDVDALGGNIADGALIAMLLVTDLHAAMAVVDGMEFEQAKDRLIEFVSDAYRTAWRNAQQGFRDSMQKAAH